MAAAAVTNFKKIKLDENKFKISFENNADNFYLIINDVNFFINVSDFCLKNKIKNFFTYHYADKKNSKFLNLLTKCYNLNANDKLRRLNGKEWWYHPILFFQLTLHFQIGFIESCFLFKFFMHQQKDLKKTIVERKLILLPKKTNMQQMILNLLEITETKAALENLNECNLLKIKCFDSKIQLLIFKPEQRQNYSSSYWFFLSKFLLDVNFNCDFFLKFLTTKNMKNIATFHNLNRLPYIFKKSNINDDDDDNNHLYFANSFVFAALVDYFSIELYVKFCNILLIHFIY